MWFRVFLGAWTLLLTALFGWLASHGSSGAIVFHKYSPGYFLLLLAVAGSIALTLLAQSAFLYSRLYRIRREIILTLTAIFFSLMMAEAATRVFDPLGISYFEESTRYQLDMISDPALGYKHATNLRRVYQGVEVSTNQFGLRDREIEPKQTGEFRILLLGDSVTFGWGVPIEATFGRRLENLLTTKLKRPVRVVNSGVGGYNTVQEYAVLKQLAGTVDPDMVVLLYVRNDIQSNDPSLNPETELTLDGKTPPEVILILAGEKLALSPLLVRVEILPRAIQRYSRRERAWRKGIPRGSERHRSLVSQPGPSVRDLLLPTADRRRVRPSPRQPTVCGDRKYRAPVRIPGYRRWQVVGRAGFAFAH